MQEKWLACFCKLELRLRKTRGQKSCTLIKSQCKCSPLGVLLTVYLDEGPGWPPVKKKCLTCSCKLELQLRKTRKLHAHLKPVQMFSARSAADSIPG